MEKKEDRLLPEQPPIHRRGFFSRLAAFGATALVAANVKGMRADGGKTMLNDLKFEHFSGLVDQSFDIRHDGGSLAVTLVEAKQLGANPRAGLRDPFSLIFRSAERGHLPQRMYEVRHAVLGTHELFLVPIGPDEHGMRYQAVFG